MATDPQKPWVLVRKGKDNPPPFATFDEAKMPHDIQRLNHAADTDATIFGPGEMWQCGRHPWSQWVRVVRQPAASNEPADAETTT